MDEAPVIRRFYFDACYALTYSDKGWALLHSSRGIVGTDQAPEELDVPYQDGQTLLAFVRDAMARGLGDPL